MYLYPFRKHIQQLTKQNKTQIPSGEVVFPCCPAQHCLFGAEHIPGLLNTMPCFLGQINAPRFNNMLL